MEAWKELHCASCFSALPSGVSVCPKCGFDSAGMPSVAESNALPRYSFLQSRYVVGRVVGSGGFGITYSAYDTFTAARVAIKEYFPREIAVRKAETGAVVPVKREDEYADGLERFAGEAITLKDLKLCKSIVRVYELFEENGTAYMVMEYIEGINLNELAKQRGGRIPYEEAREYILSTALALSEAHAKNIIHRDISPDNIIRLPNGDVKLIDFGASKSRYKSEEGTKGPILLKQSYAPPEQYSKSGNQGPWTDIYALACTFYRIITGVRGAPLPSATERQKGAKIEPLHIILPEVSINMSRCISRAMELDANSRYQTIHEFIRDYVNADDMLTKAERSETVEHRPPEPSSAAQPSDEKQGGKGWFRRLFSSTKEKDSDEPQPPIGHTPKAILTQHGALSGAITLENGKPYVVGRQAGCDLMCGNDSEVSRRHCILIYDKASNSVILEDRSRNGTILPDGTILIGQAIRITQTISFRLSTSENIVKVVM